MGGEDWALWMNALNDAGVLADGCKTVAYTYLGDKLTWPLYGHATIGKAKEDLDSTAAELNSRLKDVNVNAHVAVLKAVVTQASSAIPLMPLYLSILFKIMKEDKSHEGCIEQLVRLYGECLYSESPRLDEVNRFRVDDLELRAEVQQRAESIWQQISSDNLHDLTDFAGYQQEFLKLFGFANDSVDYDAEISPLVPASFS